MARVTVEDCINKVGDKFKTVIVVAKRAKDLVKGTPAMVEKDDDKSSVIALREIAEDKLNISKLYDDVVLSFRKNIELQEIEEDNKDLEFIEKEIIGESVFEDKNEILNRVDEENLDVIIE